LIGRKDIQHHGVGYTSSATRFRLALSHDIRSRDLKLVNTNAPTVIQIKTINIISYCRGGGPQPEENPTRTILGKQAIKQEANAYINIKQ